MDLLEVLKCHFMIYIIQKLLVLLKNYFNYLKASAFECF